MLDEVRTPESARQGIPRPPHVHLAANACAQAPTPVFNTMADPKIKTRFRFSPNGESFNERWRSYQQDAPRPIEPPATPELSTPQIPPEPSPYKDLAPVRPLLKRRRRRPLSVLFGLFLAGSVALGMLALPSFDHGQLNEAFEGLLETPSAPKAKPRQAKTKVHKPSRPEPARGRPLKAWTDLEKHVKGVLRPPRQRERPRRVVRPTRGRDRRARCEDWDEGW